MPIKNVEIRRIRVTLIRRKKRNGSSYPSSYRRALGGRTITCRGMENQYDFPGQNPPLSTSRVGLKRQSTLDLWQNK